MANVQNAFVAKSIDGGVYWRGPLGTAMPGADVDDTLDPALEDHGTCAQNGLTASVTRTSTIVRGFDGEPFVDIQTEYNGTFRIRLLEYDLEAVKKTAFGDANVEFTPATSTHGNRYHVGHNPDELPLSAHLFKTRYGDKKKNFEIAVGRVTEIAEFTLQSQDATVLELTIQSFRNPATGNYIDEYGDDGQIEP